MRLLDLRRRLRQRREPVEAARLRAPIRGASVSIRTSDGRGRTTCACSTTAPRATRTASRIRARSRSCGGTKTPEALGGLRHPRRAASSTDGPDTPNGQRAFHLNAEGVGRLFAAVYEDPDRRTPTASPRDASYVPEGRPAARDVRAGREPGRERAAPEGAPQPDAQVSARRVAPADRHASRTSPTCS